MKAIIYLLMLIQSDQAHKDYVLEHCLYAKLVQIQYGVPSSIVLAQGILESGGGKSKLSKAANNHFGISYYNSDYFGKSCGQWVKISPKGRAWRAYPTTLDCYLDLGRFYHSRPTCQWPFWSKDWSLWADVLEVCKYGDRGYGQMLKKIILGMELWKLD